LLLIDKNVFSTFCICTLVGGNDNGSRGVAMLEVARQLSEKKKKGTQGGKHNFICCNWSWGIQFALHHHFQGGGGGRPPKISEKYDFFGVKSWFFTRNTPKMFAPPSAIGKNMIFLRKIVIFHTKYPKSFRASLRSAQFF
jgi:hypothetical protein